MNVSAFRDRSILLRIAGVSLASWLLACLFSLDAAQKQPPARPINLNTATVDQLQQLPGIGPTTAQAIVKFREASGPLHRVEDLLAIHGISRNKLEKLRPYVTLKPPAKARP